MKTFKDWMLRRFSREQLSDLARHGATGGYSGLIYYHETTKLYNKYQEEIWDMLNDDAESQGETVMALIASFGGADAVVSHMTFVNLLVWYAAEKIAYEITEN